MEWSPRTLEGVERVEQLRLSDREETVALGRALGDALTGGGLVGLVGPLGAGKTTFVEGIVRGRRGDGRAVTSPTYTLVNTYGDDSSVVYHADLYRLEGRSGLESIGYWDYLAVDGAVVCVEWLDRVPEAWPGDGVVVELDHVESGRSVALYADGNRRDVVRRAVETFREAR
ncbi:MAG: tRNA (adenosine(37)-N6)-threonylcarbamoyltransferase complex ATPase subunit type 1 TsaE [Bradymonadaceae bacterium]